jgi:YVTN family beta-propeller protein
MTMRSKQCIWLWVALGVAVVAAGCGIIADLPGGRRIIEVFYGVAIRCEKTASSPNHQIRVYNIDENGDLVPDTSSPIDGEDCEPSDNDDDRPDTFSWPIMQPPVNNIGANRPATAKGGPVPAAQPLLQDQYPSLLPLPFAPLFTPAALANVPGACSAGAGVYMVNHFSSTVTLYNVCPLAVSKRIQVGSHPLQLALTPDGTTLVVTRYDNAVAFVDTATSTVTTLATPQYNPSGIAISPDGSKAYVTSYIDTQPNVVVIDMASRKVTAALPVAAFPKSIFLTPDGAMAWVTFYQSTTLYVIDTLSMTVTATVNAGSRADTGMAISPNGTRAYVATAPDQLVVFDTATLAKVGSVTVGKSPSDVLVTPDGTRAYVNSQTDAVLSVVDLTTNTLIRNAAVKAPAMGLAIVH